MNDIFKWSLAALGEVLLITIFILYRGEMADNVLTLNIVVSSIIYAIFVSAIIFPMVNLKDKTGKGISSLGMRWFFTSFYCIAAIVTMIACYSENTEFRTQFLIHAVLLFLLLLGLLLCRFSSGKTEEVFHEEKVKEEGVKRMRRCVKDLSDYVAEAKGLPNDLKGKVNELSESVRYISHNSDAEAVELEERFIGTIGDLQRALPGIDIERERVYLLLDRAIRQLGDRRSYHS